MSTVISAKTRRLYQIFNEGSQSWITGFDLRTLPRPRIIGTISFEGILKGNGSDFVDEEGSKIFLPILSPEGFKRFEGIAVLDERSFRDGNSNALKALRSTDPIYSLLLIQGFRFEPRTRKVLMVFDNLGQFLPDFLFSGVAFRNRQPAYFTFLAQWDADKGTQDWLVPVRSCSQGQLSVVNRSPSHPLWDAPFLSRDASAVNVLCTEGETGTRFVQIALDDQGRPTESETAVPGPTNVSRLLIDPAAQRSHVIASANPGAYVASFDWTSRRIVGTIAASRGPGANLIGAGLDPQTGRLYMLVPPGASDNADEKEERGAFLLADGRRSPLPQALAFRDVTAPTDQDVAPIVSYVFPERQRTYAFVRSLAKQEDTFLTPFFRIIEDPVPVSQSPPLAALDLTVDVTEIPGETLRAYAGETGAFGWRALVVEGGPLAADRDGLLYGPCPNANRDVRAAFVERAALSSIIGSARAFPAAADFGTQEDVRDLSRCWGPDPSTQDPRLPRPEAPQPLDDAGPGWNITAAECTGDDVGTGADPDRPEARAESRCRQSSEQVEASADYPLSTAGGVSVGRAYSVSRLFRDPSLGLVAETQAITEGIAIEGVGTIDLARSLAWSRANGRKPRPGDPPRTRWEVQLCGVRTVGGFEQSGCSDPDAAVNALNTAAGKNLAFVRPRPNPVLLQGTPGGYLTGIQLDDGDSQVSRLQHGDDLLTVPALEIQVKNDSTESPQRYVVQLAGVRAVTTYGISLIPEGLGGGGGGSGAGVIPPVPPVGPLPPVPPAGDGGPVNQPGPVDDIVRVIKRGLDVTVRAAIEALLAAGIWSMVATPVYLLMRRRRLRFAR